MLKKRSAKEEVVYYPQEIPDNTEELLKLAREARIRAHNWDLEEKRRREDFRNARILASGEDKYLHAVNLIIEYAGTAKSSQNVINRNDLTAFSIPYNFFNFEDHIKAWELLKAFLFKLKNAGCFESFIKGPTTFWGFNIGFHKVNVGALVRYKNKIDPLTSKANDRDITAYFGFDGMNFWLKQTNNSKAVINFYPKNRETTNPYCLLFALVYLLKKEGSRNGLYLEVIADRNDIINIIKSRFKKIDITPVWIKSTKGNLVKKIPKEYIDLELIKIKRYDERQNGYPFALKLPYQTSFTPQLHPV